MMKMLTFRSRKSRRHWFRRGRTSAVIGIVTFALLAGTGVSYAAWTANAKATSTAKAATLALTTTNFASNNYTFSNEKPLSVTGSVTIKNTTATTSSQVPALKVAFARESGSAVLAQQLKVSVWVSSTAAPCATSTATPANAIKGTWQAFPAISATLGKGLEVTYCVRTEGDLVQGVGASPGNLTFSPQVSASLTVGNFVSTTSATTTQSATFIHPAGQAEQWNWHFIRSVEGANPCLDGNENGTASGTILILYGCKSSGTTNQEWHIAPSNAGYVTVAPRNSPTLRWDGNGSTSAGVTLNTASGSASQDWQMQQVSTGVFQFVNRASGYCLTPINTAATNEMELGQAICDGTTRQHFTLTKLTSIPHIDTINCANTTGTGTSRGVTLTWTPSAIETYSVQYRTGTTGAWTQIATVASGSGSYTWRSSSGAPSSGGTANVRVVAGTSTDASTAALAVSTVWKGTGNGGAFLRCSEVLASVSTFDCSNTSGTGTARLVQFAWGPASTENYTIQYRRAGVSGNWTTAATVVDDVSSHVWSAAVPTVDGAYDVRLVAGTSVSSSTPALAVQSMWKGTSSSGSFLRCSALPPAIVTSFACQNTGTWSGDYNVRFEWSPASTEDYSMQFRAVGSSGSWTLAGNNINSARIVDGQTSYTWPSDPPSNGTYDVRLVVGSSTAASTAALATSKLTRGSGLASYVRCAP